MKTITREDFKMATLSVIKEIIDITAEKNGIENGATFQLVALAILAKMDKKLFGEED